MMNSLPYVSLVRYKQWADRGLYEVAGQHVERLGAQDATILLRILDHIHVVDRIFKHHLCGLPHPFRAPRSDELPTLRQLAEDNEAVDDWYASYVANLAPQDFDDPLELVFTSGAPARMTRGEIVLHVCMHGTYHRGNAGLLLQKNGVSPNDDRFTDFLDVGRPSETRMRA